jgi:multiple sugar transport system permease protein
MFPIASSLMMGPVWGPVAALSMFGMVPSFVFILLVQRHIVRGLTMGLYK